jgi:hypothetical protein
MIYSEAVRTGLRDTEHLLSNLNPGNLEPCNAIGILGHTNIPTVSVDYLLGVSQPIQPPPGRAT